MKVIYIIGAGGIGSTQLGANLANDLSGFDGGELMRLQRYKFSTKLCTCSSLYSKCDFWKRISVPVTPQVPRASLLYFLRRIFFNTSANEEERLYVKDALNQLEQITTESGASCIVDSSKSWKRWFFLHSSEQVDLTTIYVTRSVRDYVKTKTRKKQQSSVGAILKHFRVNLATKLTLKKAANNQSKIIFVKYNEIVYEDLLRTIKDLGLIDGPRQTIERHSVGGNRNRLKIASFNVKR